MSQTSQGRHPWSLAQLWTKPWWCGKAKLGKWYQEQIPSGRWERSKRPLPHFAKKKPQPSQRHFQPLRVSNRGSLFKGSKTPARNVTSNSPSRLFLWSRESRPRCTLPRGGTLQNLQYLYPLLFPGGRDTMGAGDGGTIGGRGTTNRNKKWAMEPRGAANAGKCVTYSNSKIHRGQWCLQGAGETEKGALGINGRNLLAKPDEQIWDLSNTTSYSV